MADKALAVMYVFGSFTRREIDPVNVHGIGVPGGMSGFYQSGLLVIAIPSSLELPESYHVLVEFSSLIEPLLPFPFSFLLSFREGSGSCHDC